MKAFTDISQSKKLAEILPIESADMWFANGLVVAKTSEEPGDIKGVLPCWSLTALLGVLPNNEHISTTLSRGSWKIDTVEYVPNTWWCEYEDTKNQTEFNVSADNPVDACYEMILKLHEQIFYNYGLRKEIRRSQKAL